jgi:hypothetical protein
MLSPTDTIEQRLLRRKCVACGYDGALLRDGMAPRCAKCGCDLRVRPARSYIEMEGFPPLPSRTAQRLNPDVEAQLVRRWVAFMFLVMFGLVVIIYLSAAAFTV